MVQWGGGGVEERGGGGWEATTRQGGAGDGVGDRRHGRAVRDRVRHGRPGRRRAGPSYSSGR
jgi:hypothetical protein